MLLYPEEKVEKMNSSKKVVRHNNLKKLLKENPFSTDEQLAELLQCSIQTIRLDRVTLGIPELRARTRTMAENAQNKVRAITNEEIVGELLDLELNKRGISTLKMTQDMLSAKSGIARGYFLFAMANTLALAVVDAQSALTEVGNIKYKVPVYSGDVLIAKAEVTRHRANRYYIWVNVYREEVEVFRAKFIIVPQDSKEMNGVNP